MRNYLLKVVCLSLLAASATVAAQPTGDPSTSPTPVERHADDRGFDWGLLGLLGLLGLVPRRRRDVVETRTASPDATS